MVLHWGGVISNDVEEELNSPGLTAQNATAESLGNAVSAVIDANESRPLAQDVSFYSGYKDPTSDFEYSFNVLGVQIGSEGVAVQIKFGGGGFMVVDHPTLPEYLIKPNGSMEIRYPYSDHDNSFRALSEAEVHEDDNKVFQAIMEVLLEEMSN